MTEALIAEVLIVGLAGWRLASWFVQEDGPFEIFGRLRRLAGAEAEGEITGFLPSLLSCVWCASVWSTLAAWGFWEAGIEEVPIILAAMAVAVIANRAAG